MANMDDPRPRSAVTYGVGLAGLVGLVSWLLIARHYQFSGPNAAIVAVLSCGIPMVLWSLLIDKVHHNPSTGIDWAMPPRPLAESFDISLVKLAGLWATWAGLAIFYFLGRWYWQGQYEWAMALFGWLIGPLFLVSIPYIIWLDRKLVEPKDELYAFGHWLLGLGPRDRHAVADHLRAWAVKGFFTAFMVSIVPGNWAAMVTRPWAEISSGPVGLTLWLISVMFLIDVAFATVGYLLTLRPLDAHIRSANPYTAGWVAALICYPPFVLMNSGQPLDYHSHTQEWFVWLADYPLLLWLAGIMLIILTAIYAWATVVFGLRFSNLTHRGILTHGPYRWTRHPAYLSKNIFWWIGGMPFLVTSGSWVDLVRNCVTLLAVNGVYYWRARTEERHLLNDPAYRAYYDWMERNAPLPRLQRWLTGQRAETTLAAPHNA
jgi:protein-S-isoprenylcysteine O-methyltransferase Ste14